MCKQPPIFHPEVLWLLKSGWEHNGAWKWVDQMMEFHALLSGTLAVIHPWMYATGREVLICLDAEARLWGDMDMCSTLPMWNSIYNSVSIMVNHTTPDHTDINGWKPWLDMLV
ncbi:hypothetical protein F5141DRAFT_997278 [Pisolithus sp. B1]|nr:hypothetical protein F5141DRAFT_997278 [Pisolithus sp. B1]